MNLLKYEKLYLGKGYKVLAGVDEVGLGAGAGPVVACAIAMDKKGIFEASKIHYMNRVVNDSKEIPPLVRRWMCGRILGSALGAGIGVVDISEVNHMRNIRKAGYLARFRAVQNIARSTCGAHLYWHPKDQNLEYAMKLHMLYTVVTPGYILVDGPFGMPEVKNIKVKSIVGGDGKSILIAAASIVAKVHRDRMMSGLSEVYPYYGWDKNAGYLTQYHRAAIKRLGVTPYHRLSFRGVREYADKFLKLEK